MSDFRFRARQITLLLLWVGFIIYATAFAPAAQPNTLEMLQALVLGQWSEINPLIVALFNVMGLWPVIYAAIALVDGRTQSFPAWPFVVLSFGLGAFALLPYLALRQPYQREESQGTAPSSKLDGWVKRLEARWVGISVLVMALGLILFGFISGSWSEFVLEWQTDRFIHIMSLDFCALSLLFPCLLGDDIKRRETAPWPLGVLALLPLIGPAIYLTVRPPLLDKARS